VRLINFIFISHVVSSPSLTGDLSLVRILCICDFSRPICCSTRQCWLRLWVSCTVVPSALLWLHSEFGADYKCPDSTRLDFSLGQTLSISSHVTLPHRYMGLHSVTCHPAKVTFPPLPPPKLVLNLATMRDARVSWPGHCNKAQPVPKAAYREVSSEQPTL